MLAKLGELLKGKNDQPQTKIPGNKQAEQPQQYSKDPSSFYSLENDYSKFDLSQKIQQSSPQLNTNIQVYQTHLQSTLTHNHQWKVRKQIDVIQQETSTVNNKTSENGKQGLVDKLNISEINAGIQNQQHQISLLKEIELLNTGRNPKRSKAEEDHMIEMHRKIQILKQQQQQLQKSLGIAMDMLKNSQNRNSLLEQELIAHKQPRKDNDIKLFDFKSGKLEIKQIRNFPQRSQNHSLSKNAKKLKAIYKQCCMKSNVVLFENQAYNITIEYDNSNLSEVSVSLALSPKQLLLRDSRYKFMIKLIESNEDFKSDIPLNKDYKTGVIKQKYSFSESSKINPEYTFTAIIGQYDTRQAKPNTWELLVPIPIVWFLRERLYHLDETHRQNIIGMLSKYEIKMQTKRVNYRDICSRWWSQQNRLFSVIGSDELMSFTIAEQQVIEEESEQLNIKLTVLGKRNGEKVKAMMEFVSFYLSN